MGQISNSFYNLEAKGEFLQGHKKLSFKAEENTHFTPIRIQKNEDSKSREEKFRKPAWRRWQLGGAFNWQKWQLKKKMAFPGGDRWLEGRPKIIKL